MPARPSNPARRRTGPLVLTRLLVPALLLLALIPGDPPLADPPPLPEPLTLEAALTQAEGHPRVQLEASGGSAPVARRQPLFLGCHELAFTGTRGRDDGRDVGWSALIDPVAAQRLEIRQRFYDVLLGDLSYARDNEALAVAYIQYDRAAVRQQLGQFSPLKTAELEAEYQLIRRQRAASEASQRITRSLLAQAMGRPTSLPRDLATPDLTPSADPLPDLDSLVRTALAENQWLQRLRDGRPAPARALLEMEVRQQALELLIRLDLLNVTAEQARIESSWRDLKLDESRTLYELEVRADLGFSMSQQTKAKRDEEAVALCQALTRAELAALLGRLP